MQQRVQNAAQATGKQLTNLQEKSKVYVSTIGKGNTKDLDVAILKATTNSFHVVPKDKHVRTLKNAVHPAKPRREVQYIIAELLKRLYSATDWVVALKTLIVIHRLMRETDPSFVEELIKTAEEPVSLASKLASGKESSSAAKQKGGAILRVDDFLDMSSGSGSRFEFSEWVRAYGKYLDEQLDVYSTINFYLEQENTEAESRMRRLGTQDLLFQLPKLHKLLQRLTDCVPRGQTPKDEIVQLSVILVVKESFKLYKSISEGIINLADCFFDMERLDASKGLELYKQYITFTEQLQNYYSQVDQIQDLKSHMRQPLDFQLTTPPPEFLQQMEDYAAGAPRKMEDGVVVAGSAQKVSPPLRRGQRNSRILVRPHLPAHNSDPGMVLAPGASRSGPEVVTESPSSQVVESKAATSKEVDLLAMDFDQGLVVDTSATSAPAPDAAPSPLADLFGNSFSSAPSVTGLPPQPQPLTQQASTFAGPPQGYGQQQGPSPGNPFGGAPSLPNYGSIPLQGPSGGTLQGPPPAPLQVQGLGATGFAEPAAGRQSPAMSSPFQTNVSVATPSYSPQASNGAFGASWGGGVNGAPSGAPTTQSSPVGSAASPAKGLQGTNIRDSALHDPFAEFNSLRKPAQAAPVTYSPSMKAARATGDTPVSPLNNVLGVASHRSTPLASPQPSFPTASPPFAVAPSHASFQSAGTKSFGSDACFGAPAAGMSSGVGGGFGQGVFTGTGASHPSGVNGAAGFPTRFDNHTATGLL